jgi:hypothetical protein
METRPEDVLAEIHRLQHAVRRRRYFNQGIPAR